MTRRTKPPHEPTRSQREMVQLYAAVGTRHDDIARVLGIDPKTLRKHYRNELDLAAVRANATIGGALFNKAKGGDTASMIFWMKTRGGPGWRERQEVVPQVTVNIPFDGWNIERAKPDPPDAD